jgi:hypothetical protein
MLRTGKRNATGMLKDGINSVSRYYINNFHDDVRQVREMINLYLTYPLKL